MTTQFAGAASSQAQLRVAAVAAAHFRLAQARNWRGVSPAELQCQQRVVSTR